MPASALYRDDAVVLRVQKLGESDRIITPADPPARPGAGGRARACAAPPPASAPGWSRSATSTCSCGRGQQLAAHGHARSRASSCTASSSWTDYPRYTAASAIAETAERLTPVEQEPSLRLFLLTLGALQALAAGEHAGTLVLDAYLLRAMAYAGWAPALRRVRGLRHGRAAPGVLRPGRGRGLPRLPPARRRPPGPATLDLMIALIEGDWARRRRERCGRCGGSAAVWSRRTCSGTSSAGYARCRWSIDREST